MKNFFTFEGCEGVGKSSQLRLLKEYCLANSINALFTREPGGSNIAEEIRGIILNPANSEMNPVCEALLFASARNQHLCEVIIPALHSNKIVFCDRYVDSSFAYQGFGRGLGLEFVKRINELAVVGYMPEITVFLDLPPEEAFKRKGGANTKDRMEKNNIAFFDKIYFGYKEVISKNPERFFVVDASGTKVETHEKIMEFFKSRGVF